MIKRTRIRSAAVMAFVFMGCSTPAPRPVSEEPETAPVAASPEKPEAPPPVAAAPAPDAPAAREPAAPRAPADMRSAEEERTLIDFNGTALTFAFESWNKKVKPGPDALLIKNTTGSGGGGLMKRLDLTGFGDGILALRVRKGAAHESLWVTVALQDEDGTEAHYRFHMRDIPVDEFVTVQADAYRAISHERVAKPGKLEGLDLANIKAVVFMGAWQGKPMDLEIDELKALRTLSDELLAKRVEAERKDAEDAKRNAERKRAEAERLDRRKQALLGNAKHQKDGPNVIHIGAVAPTILGVTIQEKEYVPTKQIPYEKRQGDVIERTGHELLCVEGGEVVKTKMKVTVKRPDANGNLRNFGTLVVNQNLIKKGSETTGKSITRVTLDEPKAYLVSSPDDANYARPLSPVKVHIKRKPNAPRSMTIRHWVYLELPKPLVEGTTYTVAFKGVNTRQANVEYVHDTTKVRSDAVHVSHVGYRSDDPYKRAFLSMWLGTGGARSYDGRAGTPFHVVNAATGARAYEGTIRLASRGTDDENFLKGHNHTKADVYHLDFSAFTKTGTYRVSVPGIGCSYDFVIGDASWREAFRVSLLGFLTQRSGIALGPPVVDFVRPRDMHPADGAKIFASKYSPWYGGKGQDGTFAELQRDENRTDRLMPDAWGGYHDAADWDRGATHMLVTYEFIELYDLFPAYFNSLQLSLPAAEANNDIPDILDEALWNLDFFRRLQEPDGGVRNGIESTAHPREGECSWQESLMMSAFAPDPYASSWFAACAAKLARVVADRKPAMAATYRAAAIRAWEWTEAEVARIQDARLKHKADDVIALSSLELYWLTKERRFHDRYVALSILEKGGAGRAELGRQRDSIFTYARMPDDLADVGLKSTARAKIVWLADEALKFGDGNSFGISMDDRMPPMGWVGYLTKPGVHSRALPRAYYLTREAKYLGGTIRATQFAIGANPMNQCLTTGLGPNPIKYPMYIDAENSGQDTPPGVTVYGISDPAMRYDFDKWAHQWLLNHEQKMFPNSYTWPANESYWDVYVVPSTNEYQPHVMGQSAYYWGFLAARESL